MTRTSRAAYPRAINKDRSKSRSGLDPNVRKGGAGYHNWGSIADEAFLEAAAIVDEQQDKLDEKQEDASPGRRYIRHALNLTVSKRCY
jgi:hypothetical protein